VILERLAATDSLDEQAKIVSSLKYFIYDNKGLSFICQHEELVNLCISMMSYFWDQKDECSNETNDGVEEDQMETAARGECTVGRIDYVEKVLLSFKSCV
jgi:hypothetical protein